jgi:uncharacterized protein YihD (DUF1040 family)
MEKIKRVIELRVQLLRSRLKDDRDLEEIKFLERILDEINGTATGHILLDLLQGDPEDWLIQHPIKGE